MAMSDTLEQFSKLPTQHKVLGFVLISVVFGVLFFLLFYSSLMDEKAALSQKIRDLEDQKVDLEAKQKKYLALRTEVSRLLEKQKELMKILPAQSEIHTLLRSIHAQAELAGLNILAFEQRPEVREKYYAKIPVKLEIAGSFHQINRFFHAVGQLKRIVNIQNLTLTKAKSPDQNVVLVASFLASTFRFLAPVQPGKAKGKPGQKG